VNARREIALGGEAKLGGENLLLPVVAQAGLPAVEPKLANGGGAVVELLPELGQPFRRALVNKPRMQPEARQHAVVALGQGGNRRPVAFASAVDDHS